MTDSADDPRVVQLAREYLAELEAGRTPDRPAFEGRFPELSAAVADCLDGVDLAHAAGVALKPPAAPDEPRAEPLGDFRIVREIGRGGMGVVYEAVQLSLGRRVALKVLPFAAGLDAKQLQRFKTEAHAAAQLHHTNIVPVYAVGCERGTHFYAMQLIDGRPLDSVVRDLRGDGPAAGTGNTTHDLNQRATAPAAGEPTVARSGTAGTRERHRTAARLAVQVADALDYAHEAGVIHRDVKPANLLLDPKGNVWVTDFGLAQVNAEANVTRTGDVFGTLRYMSPEQAAGNRVLVDHRTDVYSLGATLYELLTLHPIFPGTDRQSLLHAILTADPTPPRRHDRTIPSELETIVLKATAKLPQDRYATTGELAADLRRFLDDRPILARRPTALDHVRKWLRRHPAYVGAAVLLLVLAAVGFAASTAVIAREKGRTDDALAREKRRAVEAEERFELARRSVDDLIRVANDELANDPVQEGLRRKLLESALAYYQEFIALRQDDPTAQEELKATQARVRAIVSDLAVMQGAVRHELLRDGLVQDELRLSGEQRQAVRRLFERVGPPPVEPGRGRGRPTGDQWSQRLVEHLKALDAAVAPLLDREQSRRLDELVLQARGPMAFRDPEVVKALGLTVEQRDRLRAIGFRGFGPRPGAEPPRGGPGGRGAGGRGGDRNGPQDHLTDIQAMTDRMFEVLTPGQQASWKAMTGAPLAGLRMPSPFRGFGGPPRPGD